MGINLLQLYYFIILKFLPLQVSLIIKFNVFFHGYIIFLYFVEGIIISISFIVRLKDSIIRLYELKRSEESLTKLLYIYLIFGYIFINLLTHVILFSLFKISNYYLTQFKNFSYNINSVSIISKIELFYFILLQIRYFI